MITINPSIGINEFFPSEHYGHVTTTQAVIVVLRILKLHFTLSCSPLLGFRDKLTPEINATIRGQ